MAGYGVWVEGKNGKRFYQSNPFKWALSPNECHGLYKAV